MITILFLIPECILILYTKLITALTKLESVFFDHFDYQKLWKTVALMVCFSSFNFNRQTYGIFIVSMPSLIWHKKNSVLVFVSFLLMLVGSLLKIVIGRSPVYFMVLMLLSYNHFYVTNCPNNLCLIDQQSIFLIKTSILVFTLATGCLMRSGNMIKLTFTPKGSSNSGNMNIFPFLLICLLSFNFLIKQKNYRRLRIILTSIGFYCAFFINLQSHKICWNLVSLFYTWHHRNNKWI